jgi:hypothetical protein
MKDLAILTCILVLVVFGLNFTFFMAAGDDDKAPISTLIPEAPGDGEKE